MSDVLLAGLLADPGRIAEVPVGEVPALLDALAVEEGRCRTLRALLVARFAAPQARPDEAPPPYLTQAEAAARFGVPLSTVRYLTRRGRVPAIGRGKNRRLLPTDLSRYLEECKRTGQSLRPAGRAKRPLTSCMPTA